MSGVLLLLACARPAPAPTTCEPATLDWGDPVTTRTRRLEIDPGTAMEQNPVTPEGLAAAEDAGLGTWTEGPGEPPLLRDELAPGATSATGRSLLWFLHHSDAQLADLESPTRVVALDATGSTQSAARAQEVYGIHALDALIRTANLLFAEVPLDFALITGDSSDSNQENELRWFIGVWDGEDVTPDAGSKGSQLDEDCNDPVATFSAVGADFPWYSVAGNHDVLVQGNFPPAEWSDDVLGDDAPLGTRDLGVPGAPVVYDTEPDPARRLLDRGDIAAIHLESPSLPAGHGFTADNVAQGTVTWTARPVQGVPVVILALDANPPDGSDAMLTAAERAGFVVPALEAAERDGDLVILTSHYALAGLAMEGGGVLGDVLATYPNVVLTVSGHSHVNRVVAHGDPGDASGFWEILTSSSLDWPGQGRAIELAVRDDGLLAIHTTIFDYLAPEGSLAHRARVLSAIDLQSGWRLWDGSGEAEDRNTELLQVLPEGFTWNGAVGVRSDGLEAR